MNWKSVVVVAVLLFLVGCTAPPKESGMQTPTEGNPKLDANYSVICETKANYGDAHQIVSDTWGWEYEVPYSDATNANCFRKVLDENQQGNLVTYFDPSRGEVANCVQMVKRVDENGVYYYGTYCNAVCGEVKRITMIYESCIDSNGKQWVGSRGGS